MAELCVFYLFDQIRRVNALAVHLRNTSGGLVLLDDPLDLLQVSAQQVTGDGVLKCTDGITVFQCPLVFAGMCQQSIEDTGDIGITASRYDASGYVQYAVWMPRWRLDTPP